MRIQQIGGLRQFDDSQLYASALKVNLFPLKVLTLRLKIGTFAPSPRARGSVFLFQKGCYMGGLGLALCEWWWENRSQLPFGGEAFCSIGHILYFQNLYLSDKRVFLFKSFSNNSQESFGILALM